MNPDAADQKRRGEQFRIVVEAAPLGMIVVDRAGKMILVNSQVEKLFGYGRDELLHQPLEMLVPERFRDRHRAYRDGFFAAPQARFMGTGRDLFGLRKDGGEVPVEVGLSPLRTDQGVFVLATITDVTERVRTAEALARRTEELKAQRRAALNIAADADEARKRAERSEQALRETESKWRQLAETAPDVITTVDRDGVVRFINRAAGGAGRVEEIIGTSLFTFIPPEQHPRFRETLEHVFRTGTPTDYEVEGWGPDGVLRWWSSRVGPVVVNEQVVAATLISADITAHKQNEEKLRCLSEELTRSNAELEQFAFVASHDLQEPLRKVQAFGDMLAAACGAALTDEGKDYLRRMQNAAQRMQLLINDLLAYSRIATQGKPFEAVDLAGTTREVVSDLEARIRDTGGRVEIGELPVLDADPMQMRQLLQNLIGNALKYRRPGAPPLVRVEGGGRPDQPCEITVRDNGIGFEEKYLDRIFAPFQRLHGRGEYEGTGMGLAICRKIVERHGGTITARSVPGQGSTFLVYLPRRQAKGAQP